MSNINNEELIGKSIDLAGLVQYQDGSVVSRTVLKKETGNVTVFAFAENEGLSEHTAPFDAMVIILDGEAQINIDGELIDAAVGQMVIMPASKPHSLRAVKRFKMALIMIRK